MRTSATLLLLVFCVFPAPAQLQDDEQLIFFPSMARQVDHGWELTVHGWVHEPESRRVLGAILRRAIGIDRDALSDAERATYRERTRYFLPDNERRKVITLQVGTLRRATAPTAANGQFTLDWKLSPAELGVLSISNRSIAVCALLATNDARVFVGSVHVLSNRGVSVISDIDDTVKISEVRDHDALLLNTFCRPFKAAPGMAHLYRDWETRGAQFHYVSASPWQLYIPLAEFLGKAGFPAGTFHMKDFRVKDRAFLSLLADPQEYKLRIITPLLERFPERQFVLVGDSGEKDPEIYGLLARRFQRQVAAILIRNVTSEKPASDRYKNAFRTLPNDRWMIFEHPNELPDIYLRLSSHP
jgi:phosphatidate phosphatase APP1